MLFPQRKSKFAAAVFLFTLSISVLSYADKGDRGRPQGPPPPEATEACKSLSVGEACSFSGRRGEVVGTCINPARDEEILACAPEGGPRH